MSVHLAQRYRTLEPPAISGWVAGIACVCYGFDAYGNGRLLTDENGGVINTYTYDAFGILIADTHSGTVENGIKILIPLSIYEAATIGSGDDKNNGEPVVDQIQLKPSDWDDDRGYEDQREPTADDEEPVIGPGQPGQPQP